MAEPLAGALAPTANDEEAAAVDGATADAEGGSDA